MILPPTIVPSLTSRELLYLAAIVLPVWSKLTHTLLWPMAERMQVGTLSVLGQKHVFLVLLLLLFYERKCFSWTLISCCLVLSVYYLDSLLPASSLFLHFPSLGCQVYPSTPLYSPYYVAQLPTLDILCLTCSNHPNPTVIDLFAVNVSPNCTKQPKLSPIYLR